MSNSPRLLTAGFVVFVLWNGHHPFTSGKKLDLMLIETNFEKEISRLKNSRPIVNAQTPEQQSLCFSILGYSSDLLFTMLAAVSRNARSAVRSTWL